MNVIFERLTPTATLPAYAHPGDAGMDLSADMEMSLAPGARAAISTGLRLILPEGTEGQVRPRSGLALKAGITLLNTPGTIDAGFRGELRVLLINLGAEPFVITRGMRIAQLVIAPILRVTIREGAISTDTERGVGGFGSTGITARPNA